MKSSVLKSRENYIRQATAQVRLIDEAIDRLRESSEKKDAAGRLRERQRINELRLRRDQAVVLLGRLHESCEECWGEVKRSADQLFKARGKAKTSGKAA
ncbi:MAG: sll1863 family stress response protein [Nitrospirota bacterium]